MKEICLTCESVFDDDEDYDNVCPNCGYKTLADTTTIVDMANAYVRQLEEEKDVFIDE